MPKSIFKKQIIRSIGIPTAEIVYSITSRQGGIGFMVAIEPINKDTEEKGITIATGFVPNGKPEQVMKMLELFYNNIIISEE